MIPVPGAAVSTGLVSPAVRYFCRNVSQPSVVVVPSLELPNEIVTEVTSRLMLAEPWMLGPSTSTSALRWNDMLTEIVPNNRLTLIVMPAAIEA